MRILIVEDEKRLNRIIRETLEDEGFAADSCFDGLTALEYVSGAGYDVIILDIMMPKLNGIDVVRSMRRNGISTPVLFLTALDSINDKVTGLEAGADYYLTKPFDLSELVAVVRAMTRKYSENHSTVYTISDLSLDTVSRTVTRGGKHISLTAKEFSLLEYMLRNKGVVLSREMIENNLWNYDYEGGTNVVDVYIGYLRKKIDTGFDNKLIKTVWGVGWIMKES